MLRLSWSGQGTSEQWGPAPDFGGGLLSVLLSILRSDPMVLDGLQRLYGQAGKPAKPLQDS
jgi:hypothetical protein